MAKKKQQKQSRYAAYNYAAHAQNAAEINKRDREYYEALSKEEKRKLLEEKQRSEEAYRQWEKESEDSSSTSGGILNAVKKTASAVAESAKNVKWSDFADAYRMWTQDLVSLHKDEALEHIRENNQQQEEIKMMAKYKQLALLKSDLETQLNNIDDPNSKEASDVLNRLDTVVQELSNYDQYFLNEGRSSIPIQQQMFDFNKLSSFEKSYLHDVYALHDVKSAPKATGNFFEDLSGSINQAVKNIGNTLWGGLDTLGKDLYGVVDHYIFGNGYSYDQYVLGKAMEYLDKDDPILKKVYKGNNLLSTKVAESIDSSAVGEYKQNEYTQGDWFNQAQRWKNEHIEDYKQNKQFLKDGKLHFWGASKDGIDVVDFEDINPQFKKEHEQYGGSFTDIVAHPLHGLVETSSTVGMLEYQLKAGSSVALAKLAAREIPAIAALSVIADITEPGAMLWAATQSRQEETATEAIQAITERVTKDVQDNGGDIQTITNQIINGAKKVDLDLSEYVTQTKDANGDVQFIPKNEEALSEIIKIGVAYDFPTSDNAFEQAKKDSRKGINKLINANNALAAYDYVQLLPFTSYWGSAMKGVTAKTTTKAAEKAAQTAGNVHEPGTFTKILDKVTKGKFTPAQEKLAKITLPNVVAIKDKAIKDATAKMLGKDIARTLKARDVAKYVGSKAKLITTEGVIEGLEEVNQTLLSNRYQRGEYDEYTKSQSMFDLDELSENIALTLNGIGNLFGINTSDPDNGSSELRKAFNVGFASSVLFSQVSHAANNIYGAHDDNLSQLLLKLKDDSTLGKIVAEQQENIQDLAHLGMFYDAMTKGKRSAQYMKERIDFLKENIDKENSLVTDGIVDADKKLVDALDLVLKNGNLKNIIDSYKPKFNKKANKQLDDDAKKRLYVNAAKAISDANSATELINSLRSDIDNNYYQMVSEVERLFATTKEVTEEDLKPLEQNNPKLYNTLKLLINDYVNYKQYHLNEYENNKKQWIADNRKSANQLDVDFSDEYEELQKTELEKKLSTPEKFASDPFVAAAIRSELYQNTPQEFAKAAKNYWEDIEKRSAIIDRAFKFKKNGLDAKSFVMDSLAKITRRDQRNAAKAVQSMIKDNAQRQKKIVELTGLDIDVNRISGIENAIDGFVDDLNNHISRLFGNNEVNIDELYSDEYQIDDHFISPEALRSLYFAEAMRKPMLVRKNAYLNGSQNPISIRDFLNNSTNEELTKTANEYAKLIDNIKNISDEDEVLSVHDNKKQLEALRKKAAEQLILSEIKDQERRNYIANKRKESEPITIEDVRNAENGDEQAQKKIETASSNKEDIMVIGEGEKKSREKFNGGQKLTKSEKQKKINSLREKIEQYQNQQADGTFEANSIVDESVESAEQMSSAFEEEYNNKEGGEDLEYDKQDMSLTEDEEQPSPKEEDANNDSDDHENDETVEDIPMQQEDNEENWQADQQDDQEYAGISQQSLEEEHFQEQQAIQRFSESLEELPFDGLSINETPDLSGEPMIFDTEGQQVDTNLVNGQLQALSDMENGTLDQNETSFDGTKKTATEDTIGDMISDTLFYNPDPTDDKGNPIDEPIRLRVNGEDVKLPKPLASGRKLAEKLKQRNWLNGTKKYWIVTQSLDSQNTRHFEKSKDSMTVCLILEDKDNCYAVSYRQLGETHSVKTDSEGNKIEKYTKDKEQKLRDELYVKGISWSKLVELGNEVGIQVPVTQPKTAIEKAKIAKPVFEAKAKQIARGTFIGDPELGRGSDSQFEAWFKGKATPIKGKPSDYKLKENDPEYIRSKEKRSSILSDSYEMARRQVTKYGRLPITMKQIDNQINLLRQHRDAIINTYLTLVEDKNGKKYFQFPKEIRTDVIPEYITQSNGRFNITTIGNSNVHLFHDIMPEKSMEQITEEVESGKMVFGFGLGKFGSEYEAIQNLFSPVTEQVLLTAEDGKSIGVGKAGKIYMVIDSPTGKKVPVMLRESRFNRQYREVDGKLKKVYLDDEDSWNGSENVQQFKECFEIDQTSGRPVLIKDNDGYKPSIAEILFYMVCRKFDTPNLKIDPEYFIHSGERTLIEGTDKYELANSYLGPKQLYFGPIKDNLPMQIQRGSLESIPRSQYGLIIGLPDDKGAYRTHVFMHDELFSNTPEAAKDRRTIIKAIANQMHWSMDSFLLSEKAKTDSYAQGFGSFVNYVLKQNPDKEECSFYGCPDLTFKRSDFQENNNGGLTKHKPIQYFAWCLKNGKIQTDLNTEDPFYAPFVFGNGVKNTGRVKANDVAEKLGATEQEPAQLTKSLESSEEELLFKNAEYDESYWSSILGTNRKPLFERIKSFLSKGEQKQDLFTKLNQQADAKEHNGFRDVIVFRFPKDNISSEEAFNYLDKKIKEFVEKYNQLHKEQTPVKYSIDDLKKVKARLSSEYANKKTLPVMNIYGDGSVKIYTRPMSGQFMTKKEEGFTGMYSTVRGRGKVDVEKSKKWLQKTLGLRKDQIFVTNAILRGTHDEKVFGLTTMSADALIGRIFEDGGIILSSKAGRGIEYHEGWHFVNLLLHDKQTRRAIHDAYIKTHKKLSKPGVTYNDVEEAMAEDFRKWAITQNSTGIIGKVKRAFNYIFDFLYYTEDKALYRQIYKDIHSGKYSNVPLDQESVNEFHQKYDSQGGVYSKVHGIAGVSDSTLENMPHMLSQNDFFEGLDGVVNAISNVLNLDSIDKIKAYSGKNFDEIIQIVKDLRDKQIDDRNKGLLEDFINNPSIIKKVLQDYLLSIGINLRVKKIKQDVTKLSGEKEYVEIEVGNDETGEALQREENPDNTWDKIDLTTSHKDNAAIRAKMFLKRVPKLRRVYDQDGSVQYVSVLDRFDTPVYWKYDEVWNLVMNQLWFCDTLDAKTEDGKSYTPRSIRGEIQKLAGSNAMFYALDKKFDDIEDDIQLRSQIFTTISASKNPVVIGMVQNEVSSNYSGSYGLNEDIIFGDDSTDARSLEDNGSVADRERIFSFNSDSNLQVAKNIPRTWSKNAALNGFVVYNAKTKKSTVSKQFAKSILDKKEHIVQLINKYKTQKRPKGWKQYTSAELKDALYGQSGIRETFKSICDQLGIPVDNDVIDAYIAMFNPSPNELTTQDQINVFASIMSNSEGSLTKIIDNIVKSEGKETLKSTDGKNRELDQLFVFYKENSNIGRLAIAYNYIHPQLSEYSVRDANGNLIYPINMPNELTDKTNRLNKNSDLAVDMSKSKLCEHSIILEASKSVDKNDPSTQLRLNTFAGLKDQNLGNGEDHAGLTAMEDVLCKMFLTELDHVIFPTMADKKTWQSLSSSNIKLSHDLILSGPRKAHVLKFAVPEYQKINPYDESQYKDETQYNNEVYDWYLSLPKESDVRKNIFEQSLELTMAQGQLTYKRFSDDTLNRFANFFNDELNALIDYYDEAHISELVKNPKTLIENYHGNVSNGRMDFSGNGGKFRYFYDVYVSEDFTTPHNNETSASIINALDMNLNQKLNALYELQKQIESDNGITQYVRDSNGNKQTDDAFSKLSVVQALGKTKDQCDGFELIRAFLKQLQSEIIKDGEFSQEILDSINAKLINLTEKSLQQFSQPGDVMQMLYVEKSTGAYMPSKIPVQLLKPYLDKLKEFNLVSQYTTLYDSSRKANVVFAEAQATYSLIANFTVNTILSIMEVEKVYTGEKAQYKQKKAKSTLPVRLRDFKIGDYLIDTTVDVEILDDVFSDKIKRLGGTQSPGNKLREDFSDDELAFDPTLKGNKYTVCDVEDVEIPSAHLDIIYQNFKTQLVVDRVKRGEVEFFEKYVAQQIKYRSEENAKLKEDGKSQKSDLTREHVIDRLYGDFKKVNEIYSALSEQDKLNIDNELASQMRPYTNITVSDAQVFIRPALYRKMRIRLGEWSIEPDETGYSDEIAYNICESDDLWMKDPKKSAIVSRFQINALKMSYFQNEPYNDQGKNMNKAIYNKMALFPLFKMHRSTELGKMLYDRMNLKGNEIDQIAFKSAVKVGATKYAPSTINDIGGIEKYVEKKYGISKSKWKKLSQVEKLKYLIEGSENSSGESVAGYTKSDEFGEVRNALSQLSEQFVVKEGKAKYENQYSIDYTNDNVKYNEKQATLPISVHDLRNIRLQLNTKAHEADMRAIGTQMFKLAFSNIIDRAMYGTGKSGRQSREGYKIKADIMRCISRLTNIGVDEIRGEFYNSNGGVNQKAVKNYIKTIAINNGLGETAQQLLAEGSVAAALMSRSVFEHSVSSNVNKKIVDINTKGGTAIQQSVFGFVGTNEEVSTYYDGLYQRYNNGEELNWNAKEGSMEVLLSMNFFKSVVPKNIWSQGHNARKQWLVDNNVIKGIKSDGTKSDPKPFGIGYRIPTQGMSSMFAYIVADVLPEQVGDLIVVPREFTAQTGSDFDVDKLYLANYSYKNTDTESYREVENMNADDTVGAIGNTLLDDYIDIISDRRNFANARASIDVITNTIQSELLPVLRGSSNTYIEGMTELLPYFQTLRKLEFGVGKTGIGPFALNVTNLALTQYIHLTMDFGTEGKDFNLWPLDSIDGQDGRRISDWLSAMVNAHVDVAKDAYVRDLNVNQFTYNHANLLLRCGKGITAFSFLAQPILKTLSDYVNNSGGVYGQNIDGSTPISPSKSSQKRRFESMLCNTYRNMLQAYINSGALSKENENIAKSTISWIKHYFPTAKDERPKKGTPAPTLPINASDMFDFKKAASAVSILRNSSDVNELVFACAYQIQALASFERLDKYAQSLSELVQCSQVDTKKFGNTIANHKNFLNKINHFVSKNDLWIINDKEFIQTVPIRQGKDKVLKSDVSYCALKKYFETMYLDKKLNTAVKYTKGILEHQLFTATDAYDDIFNTVCYTLFGQDTVECAYKDKDGNTQTRKYNMYGTIYKEETLNAIANGIDDIIRYNVFSNQGPNSLQFIKENGNDMAIDFIGSGKDYIRDNMKRILFGNKDEQPIFNRVAKLVRDIKKDPYAKDGYLDLINEDGEISNQFLLYLSPQTANEKYPIGRMMLSTSQMNVSTYTKRQLMSGFDQLLSSEDEEIRKIAEDLAFYAYFSTYDQNVVNGFFDLVPPDYRKQYDSALKYALSNNHKAGVLSAITATPYSQEEYIADKESVERDMIITASNRIIDVMSRNFWYNDNIVPVFYTQFDNDNNTFNKSYGDILPYGIYDPESNRPFQPWIATTRSGNLYIKVKKGKTTMLYKKIGVVLRTESSEDDKNKKVTEFDVYAIVQKAGLHKGNVNQFEFYCDANTPSIFEDNQIPNKKFAFDYVIENIKKDLNQVQSDKKHEYEFILSDGPQIDPMYISTNSDTYYHNPTESIEIEHSEEQSTCYAKFEKSVSNADRVGVQNADWTINLVTEDKGPEVNRSTSKALQEAENISDATLKSNTQSIVDQIVKSGKQNVSIFITSTFSNELQSSEEELNKLKQKKRQLYIESNSNEKNVQELADKYVTGLNDYWLDDEIQEKKISTFIDSLIYDLTSSGVKIKQLIAPLGKNRKPVAFSVITAHKTHAGVFEESKAIIYPVDKFVNDNKKQFKQFLIRVQNALDEIPAVEEVQEIEETLTTSVDKLNKEAAQEQKAAEKQIEKVEKKSRFASAFSQDTSDSDSMFDSSETLDIVSESQKDKSNDNGSC